MVIAIIVLAVLLFLIISSIIAFNLIFIPKQKRKYFDEDYLKDRFISGNFVEVKKWLDKVKIEEVTISSFDHKKLYGRIFINKNAKINVILIHGYTSVSSRMFELAKYYYEEFKAEVIVVDLRGHGKSEPKYVSFGCLEGKDSDSWIKYIETRNNLPIVVHGLSMGSTGLLHVSDIKYDNEVILIDDSGFNSAFSELCYASINKIKVPAIALIYPFLSLIAKFKLGVFLSESNALKHVKNSLHPILFVHGTKDSVTSPKDTIRLYNACPSKKDILLVSDATHTLAYKKATKKYQDGIKKILK